MPDKPDRHDKPGGKKHTKKVASPKGNTDPSLSSTAPIAHANIVKPGKGSDILHPPQKRCLDFLYNRETNEYCGRTCTSWIQIIAYSIIYLLFLCTYTLIILYVTLYVIMQTGKFKAIKPALLVYPEPGVGLTAIPTSQSNVPLIWYKKGNKQDYEQYVQAIDKFLLNNREKSQLDELGPCGRPPYGYGEKPCVIIKVNKYFHWSGKPLQMNSTDIKLVTPEVIKWIMINKNKHWLECNGYHPYDREHIGSIKYYPDPPGFDANLFPLSKHSKSPIIAIQISEFTLGVSLAIQCKLWYESGPSVVDFVLYVAPNDSIAFSGQTYSND